MSGIGGFLFATVIFSAAGAFNWFIFMWVRRLGAALGERLYRFSWLVLFGFLSLVAMLLFFAAMVALGAVLYGTLFGWAIGDVASEWAGRLWLSVYLCVFCWRNRRGSKPSSVRWPTCSLTLSD